MGCRSLRTFAEDRPPYRRSPDGRLAHPHAGRHVPEIRARGLGHVLPSGGVRSRGLLAGRSGSRVSGGVHLCRLEQFLNYRRLVYQAVGLRRQRCHCYGNQGRERRVPGTFADADRFGQMSWSRLVSCRIATSQPNCRAWHRSCLAHRRSPPFDQFRGRRVAIVGVDRRRWRRLPWCMRPGANCNWWCGARTPRLGYEGAAADPASAVAEQQAVRRVEVPIWNSPTAFRWLPQGMRVNKARTVLGPLGAWWLRTAWKASSRYWARPTCGEPSRVEAESGCYSTVRADPASMSIT